MTIKEDIEIIWILSHILRDIGQDDSFEVVKNFSLSPIEHAIFTAPIMVGEVGKLVKFTRSEFEGCFGLGAVFELMREKIEGAS